MSRRFAVPLVFVALGIIGLTAIFAIYHRALPGYFLFDELPNLYGLASISDVSSAIIFILSGDAGPLGRPIALATFAAQSYGWPDDPQVFLRVNIAIHILATIAVFLFATALARLRLPPDRLNETFWIGTLVALIWSVSPFLATTHLMIIQRMTSLSGLFVFGGLAAITCAHLLQKKRPITARLLLLAGLVFGTVFATFSKETGALLPAFAFLTVFLWVPLEFSFHHRKDRAVLLILIVVPTALLLFYLGKTAFNVFEYGYGAHRYFTPTERLLSQPAILLSYIQGLLFPNVLSVSPFMDHLPTPKGWFQPPITGAALLFWLSLALACVALRDRAPGLAYGVLFFLIGHALESTFIGIELYFAHRNYVPAFGIYFGIVFTIFQSNLHHKRWLVLGLFGYLTLSAFVLIQVTTGWNDKLVKGEAWFSKNPDSQRAAQFLTQQYLVEGDVLSARRVLDIAGMRHPDSPLIQIQRTGNCLYRESEFPALLEEVVEKLRVARYQAQAAWELLQLSGRGRSPLCPPRSHAALAAMADALLENPVFRRSAPTRGLLLTSKAFNYAEMGEEHKAMMLFEEAFELRWEMGILVNGASLMMKAGEYDRALEFVIAGREKAPKDKLRRQLWLDNLDSFIHVIERSKNMDRDAAEPSG